LTTSTEQITSPDHQQPGFSNNLGRSSKLMAPYQIGR